MVLGSAASSVTLLCFGLSGRFSTAVAARVVAGLLNGIIVAWKCSIGESCDALEQGRVSGRGSSSRPSSSRGQWVMCLLNACIKLTALGIQGVAHGVWVLVVICLFP